MKTYILLCLLTVIEVEFSSELLLLVNKSNMLCLIIWLLIFGFLVVFLNDESESLDELDLMSILDTTKIVKH